MTADNDLERQARPIRILVTNISGILSEIVMRALQEQPDIAVRQYLEDMGELGEAVGNQTDVLIVGAPFVYPPPTICHDLWLSFPALKVLVMTVSGDSAVVYWLNVERHRLETVSASTLVAEIRHIHHIVPDGE